MAGVDKSPFTDLPLIYRDSQYAARGFGINGGQFKLKSLIPKPKFLFFVKFVRGIDQSNPDERLNVSDMDKLSNINDGIVFQVKTIDRPKFNIRTETLQQYNKKRVIQTKIDYQPMTIQFHDDINDQVLNFWNEYYRFYYGDGKQNAAVSWSNDIVTAEFNEGNNDGWGYLGQFASSDPNSMHFLQRIELFQFYGKRFTKMSFVNPKISSMDHDSNDYADGSTGSGITMQFDYEGVVYSTDKKKIDEDEAAEFGLDISSYGNLPKEEIDRLGDGIEKDPDTQRGLRNPSGISPSGTGGILGGASILNKIPTNLGGRVAAGRRLLAGSGVSFGTGTFGTLGGDARTLVAGTSAAGKVPSPDLFQKAEGASKKINKFGEFVSPSNSEDLINAPEVSNSGIDSTKVNQAASQFQEDQSVVEQTVGPGQTVVSNSSQSGFSKSYGTGAALAKNEGIISKIAEPTSKLTNESADADAALSKLPDGSQQLTEKGSAIMNALRKPNSAVGVRRPLNLWTDPDKIDSNRRNLNAEKGISNPLDD